MERLKYPTRFELEQTLNDFCSRTFLDDFAQSKGIFITKATKEQLAAHLASFLYDYDDIELIRKTAFNYSSHRALAGFIISSEQKEYDLASALDTVRVSDDLSEDASLGIITQISEDEFRGKVTYIENKPGRIEFLQKEIRNFEYSIKKIEDSSFQIFVEGNKSNDVRVLEALIKKKIGKNISIEVLNFDILSSSETVNFFDKIANLAMPTGWRFVEVKHLTVRKENSEEEKEMDEDAISGITQAILEGSNLRNNEFVIKFEKSNFRFSAMTFAFESINHPYLIQIRAEFKSRPKVFEVTVVSYFSIHGVAQNLQKEELSNSDEFEIKTFFWQKSRTIFNEIVNSTPRQILEEEPLHS